MIEPPNRATVQVFAELHMDTPSDSYGPDIVSLHATLRDGRSVCLLDRDPLTSRSSLESVSGATIEGRVLVDRKKMEEKLEGVAVSDVESFLLTVHKCL